MTRTAEADKRRLDAVEDQVDRDELLAALIGLRVAQGLSQAEVARRMGISQPTVWAFEDGLDSRVKTYQRYARACGVELRMWIEPRIELVEPPPDEDEGSGQEGTP